MVNSLDRDVRKFKRQSNDLMLLIQAEAKKWDTGTVIMRNGRLTLVGGEIMPKNPPASMKLSDEQMAAFLRGEVKNFKDARDVGGANTSDSEADSKAKTLIESAQEIIMDALEQIKGIPGKIGELWASDDVVGIRAEIGTAIGQLGRKAGTAYNNVSTAFSKALGTASKGDGEGSSEGFVARMKRELGTMVNTAMANIKNTDDENKNPVIAGVGMAMGAIAGFMSGIASGVDDVISGVRNNILAQIAKTLNYLLIPPEVRKKMEASIKQMNDNFEKGQKQKAEIEKAEKQKEVFAEDARQLARYLAAEWEIMKKNQQDRSNVLGETDPGFRGLVNNGLVWDPKTKQYVAPDVKDPEFGDLIDSMSGLIWDPSTRRYAIPRKSS